MKSQPWGRKTPPASTHRPRRLPHPPRLRLYFRARVHTSASAFTLPPHGLRRRPRRIQPPAAVVIHNGLSTEKLSTSLLTALCKTFSASRLRTRIYNISFARRPLPGSVRAAVGKRSRRCGPVSRVAERRVGEREGKGGRPLAQCPAAACLLPRPCPLMGEVPCAKAECTRQRRTPPRAATRTFAAYGRAPAAYGRITVRKGGSAQGNPRPCPCVLPAAACLPPCPRPLMGEVPSAGWGGEGKGGRPLA